MSDPRSVIPIEEWLSTFRAASDELAKHSLRFDAQALPAGAVHLGLSASPARCRALARALLGMHHTEPLSDRDVVDGLSEVMNILAGKVKASMAGRDGQLHLGLPMFVANPIRSSGAETASAPVRLGPVECTLRVYRRQRAA